MCGIAGFLGSFDEKLLKKMSDVIAHRGPDDFGIWFNRKKNIGMAHRRLSIIDLSPLGHQPMWDVNNIVAIVYNGEIYNYRELKKDLVKHGFGFKSNSDTEVLLNLYLRDSEDMLDRLNGIFAFAIWDTRSDSLFIARDGLGVKPLYYTETSQGFLFASEIKALLQYTRLDKTLDEHAIHYYLKYLWCPAPQTMMKSVKKLEPGNAMVVNNSKIIKKWEYYDIPFNQGIIEMSPSLAIEKAEHHIKEAVRRQMVADVPVGAFLSGGLDSSSIVNFAKEYNTNGKLQCFTIGFKDKNIDFRGFSEDLPYAERVAKHLDVDLHTIYVDSNMIDHLEKMIYYLDEPQGDLAPINVMFICKLAREHGIKVLLSGAGGDDIFTGYRRHLALVLDIYLLKLLKNIPTKILSKIISNLNVSNPFSRRLSKYIQYADLNGDERIASYFYWMNPNIIENLYSSEFSKKIKKNTIPEPLLESLSKLNQNVHALNRMLYIDLKHFLADHNLNYTDKMSMAYGVEVRVPFLDKELVRFASSLPIKFKQHGKNGKWILKKVMEKYLPHQVIYRSKTGFGAPLHHWMAHELIPVIEDTLSKKSLNNRGIFSPKKVDSLIKMNRNGKIDGAYTILSLMCIELWCRKFVDFQPSFGNN